MGARFIILLILICQSMTVNAGILDSIINQSKPMKDKDQPVKVLIVHDKPSVLVEVKGKYRLYDPHTKSFFGPRALGKKRNVESTSSGIKWGEEFPGIYQILIVPDHDSTISLVDGVEYSGPLYIYDIGGSISIVNVMDSDDYLKKILALNQDEFKNLPEEALAAFVITARTDAMYRVLNSKSNFWNIDASQIGPDAKMINPSSELVQAIDNTRNMVMSATDMPGNVKPFQARWGITGTIQSSKQSGSISRISFEEAVEMAKKGSHAAQILSKAFPNTRVELMR